MGNAMSICNQSIGRAEFVARDKCPTCSGDGAMCPTCNNTSIIHWCESCHGYGTPPDEAAGLVCGNCMGTGIEPEETPD